VNKTVRRLWAVALALFVVGFGWTLWEEFARFKGYCTDPFDDVVRPRLSECDWWIRRFLSREEWARRQEEERRMRLEVEGRRRYLEAEAHGEVSAPDGFAVPLFVGPEISVDQARDVLSAEAIKALDDPSRGTRLRLRIMTVNWGALALNPKTISFDGLDYSSTSIPRGREAACGTDGCFWGGLSVKGPMSLRWWFYEGRNVALMGLHLARDLGRSLS
jgi:hypothetical protein